MTRWILLVTLAALLSACAQTADRKPPFPETVSTWRLGSVGGDGSKWIARYQGQPDITLDLSEMSSTTAAFSAVQNWRPEPGKLAFYKGRFFGMAQSPAADQRTLNAFVTAFEKTLPDR
jgi:hypothetical protein